MNGYRHSRPHHYHKRWSSSTTRKTISPFFLSTFHFLSLWKMTDSVSRLLTSQVKATETEILQLRFQSSFLSNIKNEATRGVEPSRTESVYDKQPTHLDFSIEKMRDYEWLSEPSRVRMIPLELEPQRREISK